MKTLRTVRPPLPSGEGGVDPGEYRDILAEVASEGPSVLPRLLGDLERWIKEAEAVDPRSLSGPGSLAFWLNLYNAGALALAGRASVDGEASVLRVPGAFTRPFVTIAGESLSLDGIEHGKVRRFADPRIHGALVCGAVSCPTLRASPYEWVDLDATLDDQMRSFLAGGAVAADRSSEVIRLSRIFSWFSGDFVRPARMPTFVPARRAAVATAIEPWLDPELNAWVAEVGPSIEYQSYDWGLRCTVG